MKILIILFTLNIFISAKTICNLSTEREIRTCLQNNYSKTKSLGYRQARDIMFSSLDNERGMVQLVYSGAWYQTNRIPEHTIVNTEHTWPKSKFKGLSAKADLHHLYPTYNRINGKRGNKSFAEIPDNLTKSWLIDNNKGSKRKPNNRNINNYSESYKNLFEPREAHKGAVARSMFYIHALYNHSNLDSRWFYSQLKTLKMWDKQYPVTRKEFQRTKNIQKVQGNYNPFVLDGSLANRLYR